TSVPQDLGADEVVHKEEGDSVERAITTAASLDAAQDSDNIIRTQTTTMPNVDIPQEGHTSGSGEGSMEYHFELTDNVPSTPHDSPLIGGYTPRSDEDRLKLQELMTMCTKLSKQVLDLEKEKDAQDIRKTKEVKQLIIKKEEIQTLEAEEERLWHLSSSSSSNQCLKSSKMFEYILLMTEKLKQKKLDD
ncbi:hypothetical protein Tco_1566343, partial [Tanacetum coccineum]